MTTDPNASTHPKWPYGLHSVIPQPPYLSQFASSELVSSLLDGDVALSDDPRWADFGYDSVADYEYWAPRLCGLVCLKMIVDGYRDSAQLSVARLTTMAETFGAYNRSTDTGWYYAPLVKMAQSLGLEGQVLAPLSIDQICSELFMHHLVVASVHPGVIRGDYDVSPTGRKGGHLVVISGVDIRGGAVESFIIQNPSGRTPAMQRNAAVSLARFLDAFAGRGFSLWR